MKVLALALALLASGPAPYEQVSKRELYDRIVVCDAVNKRCDSDVHRLENKLATRTATVINTLVVPPAPEPSEPAGLSAPWVAVIGLGGLVVGVVLGGFLVTQLNRGPSVVVAK